MIEFLGAHHPQWILSHQKRELETAFWVTIRQEFVGFDLDSTILNWEAFTMCRSFKVKRSIHRSHPPNGVLKFNVDGVA